MDSIYFFSNSVFPSNTANSISVINTCNALAKETKVYMSGIRSKNNSVKDIRTFYQYDNAINLRLLKPIFKKGSLQLLALLDLVRILIIKPNAVYGRSIFTAQLLALVGYPFYFECHDAKWLVSSTHARRYKRVFHAQSLKGLAVVSNNLGKMALDAFPSLIEKNITVIRNGASYTSYLPKDESNNIFTLGYLGGFYAGRGLDVVVELAATLPNTNFKLAGGTSSQLKEVLCLKSLPSNITCLGYLAPGTTEKFRSSVDALIAPYQDETTSKGGTNTSSYMSPVKIFEYMSSGTPIISSNLLAIREVLNEESALLVSPRDIEQWVEAINRLVFDKDLGKRLSKKAYKYFVENLTWEKRAHKILRFSKSV